MTLSNHRKFQFQIGNTSLLEFDLANSVLRLPFWPKMKFKEDFLNIFLFIFPFFQVLFKRWMNTSLKSYQSHLLHKYFIIILSLTKQLETMVGATLSKNTKSSRPKQSDDSCFQENQEQYEKCTFSWPVKLMF